MPLLEQNPNYCMSIACPCIKESNFIKNLIQTDTKFRKQILVLKTSTINTPHTFLRNLYKLAAYNLF